MPPKQTPAPRATKKSTKKPGKSIPKVRVKAYNERVKVHLVRVIRYDGLVTCHVPKGCAPRHKTPKLRNKAYCIRLNGQTIGCQRLSYLVNRGTACDKTHIYHLCGNQGCCKPSHLVIERASYNRTRFRCPGYVRIKGTDKLLKVCPHSPPCIKVTDQDSLDTVDPKDVDPGMAADHESDIEKEEVESQDPEESEEESEEEVEEEPEDDSESSEEEEEPVSWKFKLRPRK